MNFFIFFASAVLVANTLAFSLRRPDEIKQNNAVVPGMELEGRIANGAVAAPGQFPYQVGLTCRSAQSGMFCGGSIVSPKFILTAAHCTAGAVLVKAYLGATKRFYPEMTYVILKDQIYTHPKYNLSIVSNDIALLEMPPTTFTKTIQAVQLPTLSTFYSSYAGYEAVNAGWGRTSDSSGLSQNLHFGIFEIMNNSACMKAMGPLITSSKMCISTPNAISPCNGDSGGPLVLTATGVQVGLVSFRPGGSCMQKNPVMFTRVTSHLDWIHSIIDN